MKIRELLRRTIVSAPSTSSITDIARLMGKENVGLVVLVDQAQRLAGVVSERDIIRAVSAEANVKGSALEIATKTVITANVEEDILDAAKLMNKHRIRHIVATTPDGKPMGVVSIRDLVAERATLKALAESYALEPFAGGD